MVQRSSARELSCDVMAVAESSDILTRHPRQYSSLEEMNLGGRTFATIAGLKQKRKLSASHSAFSTTQVPRT